jgi:hypothetical protein
VQTNQFANETHFTLEGVLEAKYDILPF